MAETNVDKIPGADAVQAPASRASDAGKVSTWTSFRKNKLAFYSLLVVILFVILSILAPLLVPHDPLAQNPADRFESSSGKYWLGTDAFGRDVLSRILIGSQTSLAVGFIAVAISGLVGFSLGMIAAYKGGWLDDILMRITESIMTIPIILLGMLIMVAIGANMTTLIIVICIGFIPSSARMARASTLEVKEKEFIKASISMGGSDLRILLVHILPNIMAPLLVAATLNMSSVIRVEASLSFLGMGIQPPDPTWGNMIQEGFAFITTHPWLTLSPGIALMILSIAFNLVGDGLRDAIDPHLKHQQR